MPPDARVAWVAARQHGVVGHAQLLDAGIGPHGVDRRTAAGWLHRVHKGVFAVGHPGLTDRGRWTAAVLAGGPEAVLSHRSAAALWGLRPNVSFVEVTVPGRRRRGPAGVVAHAGALDARETVVVDGIRVTTVARTLLDLAEILPVREVVAAIDRATARRLFDADAIRATVARATGRRGLKGLRAALLVTRPQDVLTRSELERRALRLIRAARLPRPEVNAQLLGHEVDLLWRDRRLAVELDGRRTHDTPNAFESDRRRDADRMARGWRVLRLTWRQVVNDPAWVASRVGAVLALAP
jgi:very-short-patch-repair endonuclease